MKLAKLGRNSSCPCGSGKKYKHCCLGKKATSLSEYYKNRYNIILKTPEQIEGIIKSGKLLNRIMDGVEAIIAPGLTTEEINTFVHEQTIEAGAIPAPLNYHGFPKSVCTSVNSVICHGIPGGQILQNGDIINVDITPVLDGYYADANKTFFVGNSTEDGEKIVSVAAKCLQLGIAAVLPGAHLGDIGYAIQKYAEAEGCSVVREFVGHGVGLGFHEAPQVFHYGQRGEGVSLVPGMVFTIEPMINLGKKELRILDDGWTAVTQDNSLSAQFEQTILVTKDGCKSLTPFDLDRFIL